MERELKSFHNGIEKSSISIFVACLSLIIDNLGKEQNYFIEANFTVE